MQPELRQPAHGMVMTLEQRLGEAQLGDGTSIAYATSGAGAPVLFLNGWLSHLEFGWDLPAERAFYSGLAAGRRLVRYDRPGCGLSGPVVGPTMDRELEAVSAVLAAAGVEGPVDLVASSLGVPVAIRWAAQNPERLKQVVLYGGFASGADLGPPEVQDHVIQLITKDWGFGARVCTDLFAPEANEGTRSAAADYQRQSSSAEFVAQLLRFVYDVDVTADLADVRSPTLVLHREGDRIVPLAQARRIAEGIRGADLRIHPGSSHYPAVGETRALISDIRGFLGLPPQPLNGAGVLTQRQCEIAALICEGMTNREIGDKLGISERSAEGHVERMRLRLGVRSRSQIAAWWAGQEH